MFRSRHTIAFSIIALYFLPILFLSFYSLNSSPINKTWGLFSFGLFFGIVGTLILFMLMIQFETAVQASKSEQDEDTSNNLSFEADQAHLDFDAIIINLNAELDGKKREIEKLKLENMSLASRLENKPNQVIKNEEPVEEDEEDEEEEEPTFSGQVAKSLSFENIALDNEKIEQSLYSKDNRVEVTRL